MHFTFNDSSEILPKYFDYHFNKLQVGLVGVITGSRYLKTGTGKSYSALKIGETVDPDFGIHKIVYSPKDFMTVMDAVEQSEKYGQVVVIDEGEITASTYNWQSYYNKAIGYSLSTFRYLRSMAIFVTPSYDWLDKRIRTLTNWVAFSEKRYDNEIRKPIVRLKFYRNETSWDGDKLFRKKIAAYDDVNKQLCYLDSFRVSLPSPALCKAYEEKSRGFKRDARQDWLKEVMAEESKTVKIKKASLEKMASELLDNSNVVEKLKTKGKISRTEVAAAMPNTNIDTWTAGKLSTLITDLWAGQKLKANKIADELVVNNVV